MGETDKMKTAPLSELAEICLGKVILKEDIVSDGNARVASVSNMTEQGLVYEDMETTQVTEEDMAKYEIKEHDVLITCRGTKFRAVLVENKPADLVIASGNLMIVRCDNPLDAGVIQLYLQSPMGEAEVMKSQKGKNSINIGKKQLLSLEIPVLSDESKKKMVQRWKQGWEKYINTIFEAEQAWKVTKAQVQHYFIGIDQVDDEPGRIANTTPEMSNKTNYEPMTITRPRRKTMEIGC